MRFIGGPLDGRTHATRTPAYEYRIVGGVYRRSRTQQPSRGEGDTVVVYGWRPEDAERWHSSRVDAGRVW